MACESGLSGSVVGNNTPCASGNGTGGCGEVGTGVFTGDGVWPFVVVAPGGIPGQVVTSAAGAAALCGKSGSGLP